MRTLLLLQDPHPHGNAHQHREETISMLQFHWCPQAHHCSYQKGAPCPSRVRWHFPGPKPSLHSLSSLTFTLMGRSVTLLHFTAGSCQRWKANSIHAAAGRSLRLHKAHHQRVKKPAHHPTSWGGLAATRGFSPSAGTESSFDQVQRVRDLYPLGFCIPKFSAQRHSALSGLQSLSLYLTNDNAVNWIKTI